MIAMTVGCLGEAIGIANLATKSIVNALLTFHRLRWKDPAAQ